MFLQKKILLLNKSFYIRNINNKRILSKLTLLNFLVLVKQY